MNSIEGHLLVASPQMKDPRFDRTVILVLHHDEEGAMGIVLNRPLKQLPAGRWRSDETVLHSKNRFLAGGPVAGPIIVIHDAHTSNQEAHTGKIYILQKKEQLEQMLQTSDETFRFYVGHAGWECGQLEDEIDEGAWMILPAMPELVFGSEGEMWRSAMREVGRNFYRDVLGVQSFPPRSDAN